MFIGLQQLGEDVSDVRSPATAQGSLIADAAAVEELGSETESPHTRVLPTMVLRGGRGVIDEESTRDFIQAGDRAFSGARSHDPEKVASGVASLGDVLSESSIGQVTTFLRVLWGTSGQTEATFPLESDLGTVSDDVLRFLITQESDLDAGLLRDLGSDVSVERLLQLRLPVDPPNLARFIQVNLDRLSGRIMVVRRDQQTLADRGRWHIQGRSIEFVGEDFSALIAPTRADAPAPEAARPLSVDRFRERLARRNVQSVTLSSAGESITIESEDDTPIAESGSLEALASLAAAIERAVIPVGGKALECDFRKSTAAGHTNAQFSFLEFLSAGLPTLRELGDADLSYIKASADELALTMVQQLNLDL